MRGDQVVLDVKMKLRVMVLLEMNDALAYPDDRRKCPGQRLLTYGPSKGR